MNTFIKTYIIDAPWPKIFRSGLIFGLLMFGLQALVRNRNNEAYLTGSWYSELLFWSVAGLFVGYSEWRAVGYLERKNARWKESKKAK